MRIERVLAPNAGPFTGPGTNTWILDGGGSVLIIDPGPIDPTHAQAVVEVISGRPTVGVLVTHTHPDHAPLANPLAAELGVAAYGYDTGPDFVPDRRLFDGERMTVGAAELQVIHTPGHADDHLCFLVGRVLFTGDHIMGGSSVLVDDLIAYLGSLRRLREIPLDRLYPGHGPELEEPRQVIDWYLAHRLQREGEILAVLADGPARVEEIVERVYAAVDPALYPLATRNVIAHLEKLEREGRVVMRGESAEVAL